MNDVFLVLAQAPGGLTCFLVPRVLPRRHAQPAGRRTAEGQARQPLQRVLGAGVPRHLGAAARRRGPRRADDHRDGRRHPARLRARLRLADAPGARRGLLARRAPLRVRRAARRQAADAERGRRPRRRVRGRDRARRSGSPPAVDDLHDPHEAALRRIALPLAKYWVCKRTPTMVAEALECLGGNGYVEESAMPLLFRESPLNSIWEGSGNVNALDVLRALSREPEVVSAWIAEVGARPRRATRGSTGPSTTCWSQLADASVSRSAPAGSPARWPPACRARCWSARPRRGRRRVLRHPARPGVRRHASAPCPAASTCAASWSGPPPPSDGAVFRRAELPGPRAPGRPSAA